MTDTRSNAVAPDVGLWFGALGPFEALWDGRRLPLGGAKQQMVLALLVLEANSVVSVDRLVDWVWHDDAAPRSTSTLQVYVSNLRRLLAPSSEQLGRQLIATRRPGYVAQLEPNESDLLYFEMQCSAAASAIESGRPDAAVELYRSALTLWRGEPLSGLPIDAAHSGVVRHLELKRLSVLGQIAEVEMGLGRHRQLLAELQTWVADDPLDEKLRGHLMVALYRCGRQAEALATYRAGRQLLVEELGLEPCRELREIEQRILDQDPSLDVVAARPNPLAQIRSTAIRTSVMQYQAEIEVNGCTVPLDSAVLTIGRRPDRDLVLDDDSVSRVHAEIRRLGTSFRLIDAGSVNGTVVNGSRVVDHVLDDGDVIRMGDVELRFRIVSE